MPRLMPGNSASAPLHFIEYTLYLVLYPPNSEQRLVDVAALVRKLLALGFEAVLLSYEQSFEQ